jgi:hypothetical protein
MGSTLLATISLLDAARNPSTSFLLGALRYMRNS